MAEAADAVVHGIDSGDVADLRLAAIGNELPAVEGGLVQLRAGVYFRYEGEGSFERCTFHRGIGVDEGMTLRIEGEFDPARFEANSPRGNLSGQKNVYIAGIATSVDSVGLVVKIRPILIGFPYYVPAGTAARAALRTDRSELHYLFVDQFRLTDDDMQRPATKAETDRLFAMPESAVKDAFATILGVTSVPKDWGGEQSDLVAELTVDGVPGRVAFAFKGPGGKRKPWVLQPGLMGKNGDQGVRLFAEPTDVMAVQHCGPIAESIRHMMEALAHRHQKRYMVLDADSTVRILRRADLLANDGTRLDAELTSAPDPRHRPEHAPPLVHPGPPDHQLRHTVVVDWADGLAANTGHRPSDT